ncbi:MAG: hypothetical protein ABJN26_00945 [Stappiaceae bacterium]
MIALLKKRVHRVAPELQFWGYEVGNVLAAIAGAGGIAVFYAGLRSVDDLPGQSWVTDIALSFSAYPDIVVTVGLAMIVLLTIVLGPLIGRENTGVKLWIDGIASIIGILLVGTALTFGASWITFAAVSFVSGSALLRLCRTSPVYLKLGGLMLAAGGVGLAAYGFNSFDMSQPSLLPVLTVLTGFYVIAASLMTYQGGIFECAGFKQQADASTSAGTSWFHPSGRLAAMLEARFDGPISVLIDRVALPSVFWVSTKTKSTAPFLTSMWTRLPWRILTACAAMATGTPAGILFCIANIFWAVGDVAIGALDWEEDDQSLPEETPSGSPVRALHQED